MPSTGKKTLYDLYVGNLPSTADEKSIKDLFKGLEVSSVHIKESRIGKKLAFVHFALESDAEKAINDKHGFSWNGCSLFVRKSDQWLSRIRESSSNYSSLHDKLNGQNFTSKASGSVVHNEQRTMTKQYPSREETFFPIHMIDPISFYAQIESDCDELFQLQHSLQEICQTLKPCQGKTSPTKIYGAKFSEDETWYRCRVTRSDNFLNKASVQYIDFGNSEYIDNSCLVELPFDLASIPGFAYKCRLQNLHPISKSNSLYDDAMSELSSMVLNKNMTGTVTSQEDHFNKYLSIIKLELNGESVHKRLVSLGFANPVPKTAAQSFNQQSSWYPTPKNKIAGKGESSTHAAASAFLSTLSSSKVGKLFPKKTVNNSNQMDQEYFNIDISSLQSENDALRLQLSRERGKNTALEKEVSRLSRKTQKPDILTQCDVYSQEVSLVKDIAKVRDIRQQLPIGSSTSFLKDYVEMAINLIFKEPEQPLPIVDETLLKLVEEKYTTYKNAQQIILDAKDENVLSGLIVERDQIQNELLETLTEYSDLVQGQPFQERYAAVEAVMSALKSTFSHFMEMRMNDNNFPPLKDLVGYYREMKKKKFHSVQKFQIQTDQSHAALISSRASLSRALEIIPAKTGLNFTQNNQYSEQNQQAYICSIHELQKALNEEINNCQLEGSKDAALVGVIVQNLYKVLAAKLLTLKDLCQSEILCKSKLEYLLNSQKSNTELNHIRELRKSMKTIRSKIRHALADKHDLEENEETEEEASIANKTDLTNFRSELHSILVEDSFEMDKAARLYQTLFPELDLMYPDLGIAEYSKNGFLVKKLHQIEYYETDKISQSIGADAYYSTFVNEPIILKEFQINEDQQETFLDKAKIYAKLMSPFLAKIEAIFFSRNCKFAYVQQRRFDSLASKNVNNPFTKQEMNCVLTGILNALDTLHSAGLVHGAIHPESVFIPNDFNEPLLDIIHLSEENIHQKRYPPANGLNFRCPKTSQPDTWSDIYAFFCVALWMLYPQTQFTMTYCGRPDLNGLEVDSQNLDKYQMITNVFNTIPSKYPTVKNILESSVFKVESLEEKVFAEDKDILETSSPEDVYSFWNDIEEEEEKENNLFEASENELSTVDELKYSENKFAILESLESEEFQTVQSSENEFETAQSLENEFETVQSLENDFPIAQSLENEFPTYKEKADCLQNDDEFEENNEEEEDIKEGFEINEL